MFIKSSLKCDEQTEKIDTTKAKLYTLIYSNLLFTHVSIKSFEGWNEAVLNIIEIISAT